MYYKNLDPLRGILALTVVVFHLNYFSINLGLPNFEVFPLLQRGTEAVMVFFVLSGYLIIGQLWDEKQRSGSIRIGDFYLRRILRLYPVYYLVLFVGVVMYHFLLPQLDIQEAPEHSVGTALLYNILFIPNVFKNLHEPGSILEILWSIGIEEQFYLIIAPIFAFFTSKRLFRGILGFTVFYFVVFHLPWAQYLRDFTMVFFFMSAGGAVAILQRKQVRCYATAPWAKWTLYLLFLLVFTTDIFHFEADVFKHATYTVIFALFIPTLAHDKQFKGVTKPTVFLGKISYGIYMYHMIVINGVAFVAQKMLSQGTSTSVVLAVLWLGTLGITILTARLSYTYFEMPFLSLKQRFRKAP